jgi:hypothetical protein
MSPEERLMNQQIKIAKNKDLVVYKMSYCVKGKAQITVKHLRLGDILKLFNIFMILKFSILSKFSYEEYCDFEKI